MNKNSKCLWKRSMMIFGKNCGFQLLISKFGRIQDRCFHGYTADIYIPLWSSSFFTPFICIVQVYFE